tara:strand:- start:137 stop:319 length:183 start_codon:yes stop_codon:yes gene_type:complete
MASPNKRRGKKLHGSFGKTHETQVETPAEPVLTPTIEAPTPSEPTEPKIKKRSFFSKDKE